MADKETDLQELVLKANPPEGFVPTTNRGPYTSHNGPYFHKVEGDTFFHGFRVLERHCNSHGILHGGMMMTFADGLLATAVWRETRVRFVTMRMTSDFKGMVRPGDWVEGTGRVTRAARSVAFAEAEIFVGNRLVFGATGLFKLFRREGREEA